MIGIWNCDIPCQWEQRDTIMGVCRLPESDTPNLVKIGQRMCPIQAPSLSSDYGVLFVFKGRQRKDGKPGKHQGKLRRTCISYSRDIRLSVRLSVCHTLALSERRKL